MRATATEGPGAFGELLRRHRVAAGLTQEKLAEQAGLSARGIADLERGVRRSPYPQTVQRLAEALGLDDARRTALLLSRPPLAGRGGRPDVSELAEADERTADSTMAPLWPRQSLTSFIGREQELDQIHQLLLTSRLLTLTGPGGIGKTRLAIEATRARSAVAFVDVTLVADDHLLTAAVAAALGVREQPRRTLLEVVTSFLAAGDQLLILDNCEQVVGACAQLAAHLLRACPRFRILATSRQSLGVAGEQLWPVPPLDSGSSGDSERSRPPDALHLFAERARLVLPGFTLDDQNTPAVTEVCRQLDGMPLAIELAAAHTRLLSVQQIGARLRDRFDLLTNGPRTGPKRQHTLQATLDWSYALLTAPERVLLRRLSVFAGGGSLELAESICSDEAMAHDAVFGLLTQLVDKSLVSVRPDANGDMRYRLLETVRMYAVQRLAEESEVQSLRRRHAMILLELAERAETELWGPQQRSWLDRLEQEHDNLRAALQTTLDMGSLEMAARLCGALWRFWATRGHLTEGRAWTTQILDRAVVEPSSVRSTLLNAEAWLALLQADYAVAAVRSEECLSLRRLAGDVPGVAESLTHLAEVARQYGDHERALALINESIGLHRLTTNRVGIADALNIFGMILSVRGHASAAADAFGESLNLRRRLGDVRGVASTLANLGDLASLAGNRQRAAEWYAESLALRRELGDSRGIATMLGLLGDVAAGLGDRQRAEGLYREGLGIATRLGAGRQIAACRDGLASLADVPTSASKGDEAVLPRATHRDRQRADGLPSNTTRPAALTPREWEVAGLIAKGLKNREIAEELILSERTVHSHVRAILSKLDLSSRVQIAACAVRAPG